MQQPTVGRIVHVIVDPKHNNGSDVAPAIITRVWGAPDGYPGGAVNLRVLHDAAPSPQDWMTSISLHESREALEEHIAGIKARHGVAEVTVRGAFWPPRA